MVRMMMPMVPPIKEAVLAAISAWPGRPFLAMG